MPLSFTLSRPDDDTIRRTLDTDLEPTHRGVGLSRNAQHPHGYFVNHKNAIIGRGREDFLAARRAMLGWQMFRMGWVELCFSDSPIEVGAVVAVLAHRCGLWSLNPCKIIYTIDDEGPVARFGFGYGTLPGHIMRGEERFLLSFDPISNEVSYDIFAFAQPDHPLASLFFPILRLFQRQFVSASAAAMTQAVRAEMTRRPNGT